MNIEERLQALGTEVPPPPEPVGIYMPAVRAGNLVFTAGQLPIKDGNLLVTGKVSEDLTVKQAQACALQATVNALAAIKSEVESLEKIVRIVRVTVYVNSSPGFTEQANVANGASMLLAEAFGDKGKHTRCAVGVSELPLDAPVELDMIVQVE